MTNSGKVMSQSQSPAVHHFLVALAVMYPWLFYSNALVMLDLLASLQILLFWPNVRI